MENETVEVQSTDGSGMATDDATSSYEAEVRAAFELGEQPVAKKAETKPVPTKPATTEKPATETAAKTVTPEQRAEAIERAKLSKQLREMKEAIKERDGKLTEYERIRARLRDTGVDPAEQAEILRRDLGLDLNEFTDRTLKIGKPVKTQAEREIEELKQWRQEREKRDAEMAARAREFEAKQRMDVERAAVKKRIEDMADRFPTLAKAGLSDLVVNEAYARQNAGTLSPTDTFEDLADEIESKARENLRNAVKAWKEAGILDALLEEIGEVQTSAAKTERKKSPIVTLTSKHGAEPKKSLDRSKMTDDERKLLAVSEAFDWQPPSDE